MRWCNRAANEAWWLPEEVVFVAQSPKKKGVVATDIVHLIENRVFYASWVLFTGEEKKGIGTKRLKLLTP